MPGDRFRDKYEVNEARNVYRGDNDRLKIPPKNHPLFDPSSPLKFNPVRTEAIDRDGHMTTAIEVWTDPDTSTLWVIDGRGRLLDVREANRRRVERGDELIKPYIVTFSGTEAEAVLRVTEKNCHSRRLKLSDKAEVIRKLRKLGRTWEAIARALGEETRSPESWCKRYLPLAYCIDVVKDVFDSHELPIAIVQQFGGKADDGSERLGDKQQDALLEHLLPRTEDAPSDVQAENVDPDISPEAAPKKPKRKAFAKRGRPEGLTRKSQAKVTAALESLVESIPENTSDENEQYARVAAKLASSVLRRVAGDVTALSGYPDLEEIITDALAPVVQAPKERKTPKAKRNKKEAA